MNAPVPHSVELIEDIPVPQEQLIAEETTLNTSSTSTSSAPPSAALAPVIEYKAPTPARAVLDEWIAHMTFEGETPAERMMLRPRSICRTNCSRAPCRRHGDQANGKPAHQKKAKKGKPILTKGYGSRIWTVIRPALLAAGYEDLLCRQPDTYGSPWRTQVRDHGFDRVLFLCRRKKGDYYSLRCIGADYDTKLKTNVEINKEKTYVPVTKTSPLSPRAFPFCGSIVRRAQCPPTKVTPHISPSSVGLVVISQRTLEILTDRMYSFSHC